MDKLPAIRQFFEAMINYKIASIISTLTNMQVKLLTRKDKLSVEQMDAELNRLEDIKRLAEKPVDASTSTQDGSK